jgi:hypothetical protein
MYIVNYWGYKGDYWEKLKDDFYINEKGKHDLVEKEWRKRHQGKDVDLISIVYV